MPVISRQVSLPMKGDTEMENMTSTVQEAVSSSGIQAGTITIFVKHTTASVMIIEDEPGIRADTKHIWEQLIPADSSWQHNAQNPGEDNGHSHLRGQMQGASLTIPFMNGALALGTWQQIVLIDFDTRARTREIIFQLIGE
ncbi:MAG: YjbQ family protein [Nitrospirota bacterium]|nr:MAG: YjbQ family protein [Nitrospirota bacterium]